VASNEVQDLKMEMESIKKTQTEENLEMENLGTQTKISEARLSNRIQEIKVKISGTKRG
jgi:predicted  nucleic acid-binding Zn-ribbon protein